MCGIRTSQHLKKATNNRIEKIYSALDLLCDTLDFERSENLTERLFSILARAFDDLNVRELENVR
jgi:flagellin-specific chaperone FliS